MDDGVEYTARTVDEAVAQAEAALGARRDDLDIDILSQGSRGVFGIGAESARIRVRPHAGSPSSVEAAVTESTEPAAEGATSRPAEYPAGHGEDEDDDFEYQDAEDDEDRPDERTGVGANNATLPEDAADVLRQLLTSMGFDVDVEIRSRENPIMIGVSGENLGVLIGRRGDNLSAIQFMVNLILSKNRRQWPRIVVDVENYRARREESLHTLAERIAYRVRRNARPFTLEAMPAGDRRIIHLALRDRADVETYSIGEGISRRVVIAPKRPQ